MKLSSYCLMKMQVTSHTTCRFLLVIKLHNPTPSCETRSVHLLPCSSCCNLGRIKQTPAECFSHPLRHKSWGGVNSTNIHTYFWKKCILLEFQSTHVQQMLNPQGTLTIIISMCHHLRGPSGTPLTSAVFWIAVFWNATLDVAASKPGKRLQSYVWRWGKSHSG